jgi:hypothetical protein
MDSFQELASKFINEYDLMINKKRHSLVEIEFYLYSDEHPDIFCHKSAMQQEHNKWYFHKSGQSATSKYKGGTYKGLDIALGNDEDYFGILIRSIQYKDEDLVNGPCNCVDHILKLCDKESVYELVESINLDIYKKDMLYLKPKKSKKSLFTNIIYTGPRVGLTLKKSGTKKYIFKPYRYLTSIPKESWGVILECNRIGMPMPDSVSVKTVAKLIADCEKGKQMRKKKKSIKEHETMKTLKDKCIMFGYYEKYI